MMREKVTTININITTVLGSVLREWRNALSVRLDGMNDRVGRDSK